MAALPPSAARLRGRRRASASSICKGRTVGAGHHRQPQPHRADGQPSRLPHAARERLRRFATCRRRFAARAKAMPRRRAGSPRSAASTATSSCRRADAALPDARGARRRRAEQPGVHLARAFTGPSATNTLGKKFFESQTSADPGRRGRLDRRRRAGDRPGHAGAPADAADARAAQARRARRDDLRPRASA